MLNYETLLSSYDDRLTLLEYLKKVETALKDASATSFSVTKTGDATIKFVLSFEDGSTLESGEIVLQQGESVASAAIDANNHLLLTLTNGDVLDAGDLFNGNVNVNGDLSAGRVVASIGNETPYITGISGGDIEIDAPNLNVNHNENVGGDISASGGISSDSVTCNDLEVNNSAQVNGDLSVTNDLNAGNITGDSIIENMTGYSFAKQSPLGFTIDYVFASIVKNGNKLTAVIAANITRTDSVPDASNIGRFNIPAAVAAKLYPTYIGNYNVLDMHKVSVSKDGINFTDLLSRVYKGNNEFSVFLTATTLNTLDLNEKYFLRYEITFLLSDNMAA